MSDGTGGALADGWAVIADDRGRISSRGTCDANGRVRFDRLSPGRYDVTVAAPGRRVERFVTRVGPNERKTRCVAMSDAIPCRLEFAVPTLGSVDLARSALLVRITDRRGATIYADVVPVDVHDEVHLALGLPHGEYDVEARSLCGRSRKDALSVGSEPCEFVAVLH